MIKDFFYFVLSALEPFVTILGDIISSFLLFAGLILAFALLMDVEILNSISFLNYTLSAIMIGSAFFIFSITHWYSKLVDVFYVEQTEKYPSLYSQITGSDQIPSAVKESVIVLHNRTALAKTIHQKNKSAFGKIINKISSEDKKDTIEVNGADLISIYTLIDNTSNTNIKSESTYHLPLPQAELMLKKLQQYQQSSLN